MDKQRFESEEEENKNKILPDMAKKLIAAGVGAAFLTEEAIRVYLHDMKVPKDVLAKLLDGANNSKKELIDRVGDEVVSIIKKIDFVEEASRFVENHKFRVSAEIEVVKKKD